MLRSVSQMRFLLNPFLGMSQAGICGNAAHYSSHCGDDVQEKADLIFD